MDNKQMQPQPGGYAPYGYDAGANAYTPNAPSAYNPNFPPAGGYPPPNPNMMQPQPGGYTPYAVSIFGLCFVPKEAVHTFFGL